MAGRLCGLWRAQWKGQPGLQPAGSCYSIQPTQVALVWHCVIPMPLGALSPSANLAGGSLLAVVGGLAPGQGAKPAPADVHCETPLVLIVDRNEPKPRAGEKKAVGAKWTYLNRTLRANRKEKAPKRNQID